MSRTVTVIKRNVRGEPTWQYQGRLLGRADGELLVEAFFDRADLRIVNAVFRKGDRFIEKFYTDRWYNIFEVHDRDDDHIKGWYSNVGRPAVEEAGGHISYVDLALDLWVTPEGEQYVLDADEFDALELDNETRARAVAALEVLQALFAAKHRPPARTGGL